MPLCFRNSRVSSGCIAVASLGATLAQLGQRHMVQCAGIGVHLHTYKQTFALMAIILGRLIIRTASYSAALRSARFCTAGPIHRSVESS